MPGGDSRHRPSAVGSCARPGLSTRKHGHSTRRRPDQHRVAGQRARLFDTVAERGLTVDVLVDNAGIGTVDAVIHSPLDAEIAQVRVIVETVIDLTTRAVQQIPPRGRGAILDLGSVSGFLPQPGQARYAGTKAFVQIYS
ncbi:SDR family NAD(P)-dependent oxidoreductase [Streptomyces sp. R21]|uniref:SDR family NAD(P)-dependent oxidoreductase n=1 Tax=Streptomyces sp. R21 TaxID=3238627 RepID=A0AB39PLP6_9ACTN